MRNYVAIWQDPYNDHAAKKLRFWVENEVVVDTSPHMPWANGRAVALVRQYFRSNGSPFYEVAK